MKNILLKKNSLDNYLLEKHNKLFILLIFTIFGLAILYVYFLFMSVSYTYASKANTEELNLLVAKNINIKTDLFKKEKLKEAELLTAKFVKLDNIKYLKTTEILVANIER
jgi:hypothetical protein